MNYPDATDADIYRRARATLDVMEVELGTHQEPKCCCNVGLRRGAILVAFLALIPLGLMAAFGAADVTRSMYPRVTHGVTLGERYNNPANFSRLSNATVVKAAPYRVPWPLALYYVVCVMLFVASVVLLYGIYASNVLCVQMYMWHLFVNFVLMLVVFVAVMVRNARKFNYDFSLATFLVSFVYYTIFFRVFTLMEAYRNIYFPKLSEYNRCRYKSIVLHV